MMFMNMRLNIGRVVGAGFLLAIGGCMAPAPVAPGPEVLGPSAVDLMHSKVDAYNAGVAAGKRMQARRDQAAIVAAAQPACPVAAPAVAAPTAAPLPTTPLPVPTQAPVYIQGGPAVPVAPAQ